MLKRARFFRLAKQFGCRRKCLLYTFFHSDDGRKWRRGFKAERFEFPRAALPKFLSRAVISKQFMNEKTLDSCQKRLKRIQNGQADVFVDNHLRLSPSSRRLTLTIKVSCNSIDRRLEKFMKRRSRCKHSVGEFCPHWLCFV